MLARNNCTRRHLALNLSHFHHALSLKFEFVFTQVHACECRRTCLCENVTVCKRYGFFSVLAAIVQKNSYKPWRPWIENGEGFAVHSTIWPSGAKGEFAADAAIRKSPRTTEWQSPNMMLQWDGFAIQGSLRHTMTKVPWTSPKMLLYPHTFSW